MMKKQLLPTIMALTLTTGAVAQDLKTNTISTDLTALLSGAYFGQYSKTLNDGKSQIAVIAGMINLNDNATWVGGFLGYRIFKNGNGEGMFYGVGGGGGPFTWDYTPEGGEKETIEEMVIYLQTTIGKRWNMSNGFTVSPYLGAGYQIGEIKASDGTYLVLPDGSKADGGFQPVLGIEGGFMF